MVWEFLKDNWLLILICWIVLSFPLGIYIGKMIKLGSIPNEVPCKHCGEPTQFVNEAVCTDCWWDVDPYHRSK